MRKFTIIYDPLYNQFIFTWQDQGKPSKIGFSLTKKDFEEILSFENKDEKLDHYYPYNISGKKFAEIHAIAENGAVSFIFNSKVGQITKKVSFVEISDAIIS